MAPGSISMTMKASGTGSVHRYSVFDGKLVNRGCLFFKVNIVRSCDVLLSVSHCFLLSYSADWAFCGCCVSHLLCSLLTVFANLCPEYSLSMKESQLAVVFSHINNNGIIL